MGTCRHTHTDTLNVVICTIECTFIPNDNQIQSIFIQLLVHKIYLSRKMEKDLCGESLECCDQFLPPLPKIDSIRWIDFSLSSIMKYHKTFHMRWQTSFFLLFRMGKNWCENAAIIHTQAHAHARTSKSKQNKRHKLWLFYRYNWEKESIYIYIYPRIWCDWIGITVLMT